MEADLSRYHQIDLVDLWRRRITYRQVLVRVKHLPPDSATATVTRGGPHWPIEAELLDLSRMYLAARAGQQNIRSHPLSPHFEASDHRPDLDASRERAKRRAAEREARRTT